MIDERMARVEAHVAARQARGRRRARTAAGTLVIAAGFGFVMAAGAPADRTTPVPLLSIDHPRSTTEPAGAERGARTTQRERVRALAREIRARAGSLHLNQVSASLRPPQPGLPDMRITDIGPELGPSYSAAGVVFGRDPRHILLGSPAGAFKSVDGGRSWKRVYLRLDPREAPGTPYAAYWIRQDPVNPDVVYFVAAFGESASGTIYRSDDFGDTSTWLQGTNILNNGLGPIADVAVSRTSSQTVLALTSDFTPCCSPERRSYLMKSTDGGLTFQFQFDTGLPEYDLLEDLADHPTFTNIETTSADPNIVYVVYAGGDISRGYVYKSVDGGRTFARLDASPVVPLQVFPHPTNPSVLFVQAFGTTSLYRSEDGGASFQPVDGGLEANGFNNLVAFDRARPSYVYVAGTGGLFRSIDGGHTFQPLGLRADQIGLGATTAGVDPRDPDTLYVNTYRGNFRSEDGGRTFVAFNTGWTAAHVDDVSVGGSADRSVYIAVRNRTTLLKTRNGGRDYQTIPNPAGDAALWASLVAVAPGNPDEIVAQTDTAGMFSTRNGGRTWQQSAIDTGAARFARVAIDAANADNVYAVDSSGDAPGFYRSTDGGLTFERTYAEACEFTDALAIDPSAPQVVYAAGWFSSTGDCSAIDGHFLLKSTDRGASFAKVSLGNAEIDDIVIDPADGRTIYLSGLFFDRSSGSECGTHTFLKSSDSGGSFVVADAGLSSSINPGACPDVIGGFVTDPRNPGRLFAYAPFAGLYETRDGAKTWTQLANALAFGTVDPFLPDGIFSRVPIALDPHWPTRLYLPGATLLQVEVR